MTGLTGELSTPVQFLRQRFGDAFVGSRQILSHHSNQYLSRYATCMQAIIMHTPPDACRVHVGSSQIFFLLSHGLFLGDKQAPAGDQLVSFLGAEPRYMEHSTGVSQLCGSNY